MFKTFLFWIGLIISTQVFAEFQDPTKPSYTFDLPITNDLKDNKTVQRELILTGIWLSTEIKRATINNVTAKEGDMILDNSVKIIQIEKNRVTVEDNGVNKTLLLIKNLHKN